MTCKTKEARRLPRTSETKAFTDHQILPIRSLYWRRANVPSMHGQSLLVEEQKNGFLFSFACQHALAAAGGLLSEEEEFQCRFFQRKAPKTNPNPNPDFFAFLPSTFFDTMKSLQTMKQNRFIGNTVIYLLVGVNYLFVCVREKFFKIKV